MSWFSSILTGLLFGAYLVDHYQYDHGDLPAWQALVFLATAATVWIIFIRALNNLQE